MSVEQKGPSGNGAISLERVRQRLPSAVLIPIEKGKKGPSFKDWQKVTRQSMQLPAYKEQLTKFTNTGVLLGPPSSDLVAIDFDGNDDVNAFFKLNPALRGQTLLTRGARGAQIWLQMEGDYPRECISIENRGEWRGGNCQSVVRGIHPSGCSYSWIWDKPPAKTKFADLQLPDWFAAAIKAKQTGTREHARANNAGADSQVVNLIRERTLEICERYLPNGRKVGHEWLLGDLNGNAGRSCRVELQGEKAGLVIDFNGHQGATLLELIASVLGVNSAEAAKRIETDFKLVNNLPPRGATEPYSQIQEKHGPPVFWDKKGETIGRISEPFWAAVFAQENVVIHEHLEQGFYLYDKNTGLYTPESDDEIRTKLAATLLSVSRQWPNLKGLEKFQSAQSLRGVIEHLQGQVKQRNFFDKTEPLVHLANCVLGIKDDSSAQKRFRRIIAVVTVHR